MFFDPDSPTERAAAYYFGIHCPTKASELALDLLELQDYRPPYRVVRGHLTLNERIALGTITRRYAPEWLTQIRYERRGKPMSLGMARFVYGLEETERACVGCGNYTTSTRKRAADLCYAAQKTRTAAFAKMARRGIALCSLCDKSVLPLPG